MSEHATTSNSQSFAAPRYRPRHLSLLVPGIIAIVALFGIGAAIYFLMSTNKSLVEQPLTATVERGTFIANVLDQGEVQSSENIEFRCEVKSRFSVRGITVLEVIEEGKMVEPHDILVKLDAAELEGQLEAQEITVAYSTDAKAAAENKLKATIEAKREYVEGTFVSEEREIQNDILLAQEEKRQAEDYYQHSQRLAAKRYITEDQLQADKFAVARADNALKLAQTKLDVLTRVTKNKKLIEFQSDIDTAKSKLNAVKEDLAVSQRQLKEIKTQIEKCTIRVPEDVSGQVVYANIFSSRGNSEWVLEPGATVRERQVLIKLPNRDLMQVRAKVNESRITSIKEGMPVEIHVDALGTEKLSGVVSKVNQYAEPAGWGGGGVKKYGVSIEIFDPPDSIRPGMNASVSIQIKKAEDSLIAPIQCIYGVGQRTFCLVQKEHPGNWETREINVLMNNDKHVLIESGVLENEILAMNPGGFPDLLEIPQDVIEEEARRKAESEKRVPGERNREGRRPGKSEDRKMDQDEKRDRGVVKKSDQLIGQSESASDSQNSGKVIADKPLAEERSGKKEGGKDLTVPRKKDRVPSSTRPS